MGPRPTRSKTKQYEYNANTELQLDVRHIDGQLLRQFDSLHTQFFIHM